MIKSKSLSVLAGLLVLTACDPGAEVAMLEEPARVAASDSPGKMLAPIRLDYEVLGTPAVGQALEIDLRLSSSMSVRAVSAELRGEGLVVPAENARFAERDMPANEAATRRITVTPVRAGELRLTVVIRGEVGGRIQTDSVTIPITAGAGTEPRGREPIGVLSTDESGEAVITLPAQER